MSQQDQQTEGGGGNTLSRFLRRALPASQPEPDSQESSASGASGPDTTRIMPGESSMDHLLGVETPQASDQPTDSTVGSGNNGGPGEGAPPKRRIKKIVSRVILILLLLFGVGFFLFGSREAVREVDMERAEESLSNVEPNSDWKESPAFDSRAAEVEVGSAANTQPIEMPALPESATAPTPAVVPAETAPTVSMADKAFAAAAPENPAPVGSASVSLSPTPAPLVAELKEPGTAPMQVPKTPVVVAEKTPAKPKKQKPKRVSIPDPLVATRPSTTAAPPVVFAVGPAGPAVRVQMVFIPSGCGDCRPSALLAENGELHAVADGDTHGLWRVTIRRDVVTLDDGRYRYSFLPER